VKNKRTGHPSSCPCGPCRGHRPDCHCRLCDLDDSCPPTDNEAPEPLAKPRGGPATTQDILDDPDLRAELVGKGIRVGYGDAAWLASRGRRK
jgi:hypothetical protein